MSAATSPTVSVIIPAFNSESTIGVTLEHLLKQSAGEQVQEIIVVDSSDNEKSKEFLKARCTGKVRMITSGVRVMPAIQRNIGAKEARGDILCFIDSDAYPAEDWVEKIIQNFLAGHRVGGGSYSVPYFQNEKKIAWAQYYLEFNEYIETGKSRTKPLLPTCNIYCEKKLFDSVGGIPELRASEDTLFGLTVSKVEQINFNPSIRVYHIFRESIDHYYKNQVLLGKYIYVYRKYYYNSKYLTPRLMPFLIPLFCVVKFGRIFIRIVLAGPRFWRRFLWSSPLFFKGLLHWCKGFSQGAKNYDELKEGFFLTAN